MSMYQEERVPIPTPWRLARELRLKRPPWWMILLLLLIVAATWLPLVLIFQARGTKSREPRIHFIQDMDKQAKFGPQATHPWFKDGRAMRLPVEGTMARGRLKHDQHWTLGYFTDDGTPGGSPTEFVPSLPPQLDQQGEVLLARGLDRYTIYCSICHGVHGAGDGPISQRAVELRESKWVPPTNLMTQTIRNRRDGQLFQAISDGVRTMPSYGPLVPIEDRWAIVAYLRELQKNQPVAPEPAPAGAQSAKAQPAEGRPRRRRAKVGPTRAPTAKAESAVSKP